MKKWLRRAPSLFLIIQKVSFDQYGQKKSMM